MCTALDWQGRENLIRQGGTLILWVALLLSPSAALPASVAAHLAFITVGHQSAEDVYVADASVEAVQDARVASQVAGRIVALPVHAGEHVTRGQVLARIDTSVVDQQVAATQAQLAQAQAQARLAHAELERARALRQKEYLSQAALDRAQAQASTADAQVRAMTAQASATHAQAAWHVVRAPFDGWLAQLPVSVGDNALPGQMLMQLYDPDALRLSAQVPESVASRVRRDARVEIELGSQREQLPAEAARMDILPAVDPVSRTVTVRVPLPASVFKNLRPGQSARLSLTLAAPARGGDTSSPAPSSSASVPATVWVPQSALVQRGELHAVYVLPAEGAPRLRQIRVGRQSGGQVEVLAGLNVGERIASDPVAAARATAVSR